MSSTSSRSAVKSLPSEARPSSTEALKRPKNTSAENTPALCQTSSEIAFFVHSSLFNSKLLTLIKLASLPSTTLLTVFVFRFTASLLPAWSSCSRTTSTNGLHHLVVLISMSSTPVSLFFFFFTFSLISWTSRPCAFTTLTCNSPYPSKPAGLNDMLYVTEPLTSFWSVVSSLAVTFSVIPLARFSSSLTTVFVSTTSGRM